MKNKKHAQKYGFMLVFVVLLSGVISGCANRGDANNLSFYGTPVSPAQERKLLAQKVYHFGFDRYDLSDQDLLSVYAHAKCINSSDKMRVRIEGHTDERGSRGYNIALGERRAQAISSILLLKGVDPKKITVLSYGKEKPVVRGHDERAWRLNRRATIVYEKP